MATERLDIVIREDGSRVVRRNIDGIGESSEKATDGIDQLKGAMVALASSVILNRLRQYVDTWSDLSSRVGLAVGDMEQAPEAMERIGEIARNTYSSLELTAEAFARNASVLGDLGYSTEDAFKFTAALNDALVVSGARGTRAASVQNALAKALAGGSLRGQELNTVLESGDRVARALAEGLGTTRNELRGMAEDRGLTSEMIVTALISQMDLLEEEAKSMPATIEDGLQLIENGLISYVGTLDKAYGASEGLAEVLILVSDNMQIVAGVAAGVATLAALKFAASLGVVTKALYVMAIALAANPLGMLAIGIAATIGVLVAFKDTTIEIGDASIRLGDILPGIWNGIKDAISAVGNATLQFGETTISVKEMIVGAFSLIGDVFEFVLPYILSLGEAIITVAINDFGLLTSAVGGALYGFRDLISGISDFVIYLIDMAKEFGAFAGVLLASLISISDAIWSFRQKIIDAGKAILQSISDMVTGVSDLLLGRFKSAIETASGWFSGITDAARDMYEAVIGGSYVPDTIDGISFHFGRLQDVMVRPTLNATAEVKTAFADMEETIGKDNTVWQGASDGLKQVEESAGDLSGMVNRSVVKSFNEAEDSLVNFVKTGKLSFSDLIDSMIEDLTRLAVRQAILGPLAAGLGAMFTPSPAGAGTGTDTGAGASAGAWPTLDSSVYMPYAKGGIVKRPTIFPMARGMGLMGEAGPEAILPLTRLSGGDLGVKAQSDSPSINVPIKIVIENQGAPMEVTGTQEANTTDGIRMIKVMVREQVQNAASEGYLDRPMQQRYGLRVKGR